MKKLNSLFERFFPAPRPVAAGVYHYQSPADSGQNYRLHLRIEPGGTGILILNASTVLHLNHTAAEMAWLYMQNKKEDEAVDTLVRRYRVSREEAQRDFREFQERLDSLVSTQDLDPVTYLDLDRVMPYSTEVTAPYRLDCALTYRTSGGEKNIAPTERVRRELETSEWQAILNKAWEAGIPHVIFTGGEPTLRDDLCTLVEHAEKLGMVSGVLTDGSRLSETGFLHRLLQSGLDHLMILLDPAEEQSWEAIRDCTVEDIFVTVHVTINSEDPAKLIAVLDRLAGMGVRSLSLSATSPAYQESQKAVQTAAGERGLSLVWDLPVPYSTFHPLALELAEVEELPNGAGRGWLYIEPDGDVLPAQGQIRVLGNLLADSWETIWNNR